MIQRRLSLKIAVTALLSTLLGCTNSLSKKTDSPLSDKPESAKTAQGIMISFNDIDDFAVVTTQVFTFNIGLSAPRT